MKHIHLYLFALISVILTSCSHACQKVELQEDTVSLLRNPCMGWGVYDDANDEVQNANIYWAAQDEASPSIRFFLLCTLEVVGHGTGRRQIRLAV